MKSVAAVWSFVIGGILGILLVRFFFLNAWEEIGWNLFWGGGAGPGKMLNADIVLNSSCFSKCMIGFIIGGLVFLISCILIYNNIEIEKHKDI